MKSLHGLRWVISLKEFESHPHFELFYRTSIQCVSQDDYAKHTRFAYRDDSLACLISRLLYRQVAVTTSNCTWKQVKIDRTRRGKPFITFPERAAQFNISHQGDLVVLATDADLSIGVDVMKIDARGEESADEHRMRMYRLFTEKEHKVMKARTDEKEKWTAFYRIWCLKEVVLKATGTGLVNDLRKLEFLVDEKEQHEPGCLVTSTVFVDHEVHSPNWVFEESFVGEDHTVAVGRICPNASVHSSILSSLRANPEYVRFEWIDWERILKGTETIHLLDDSGVSAYQEYMKKEIKHF